ncbi:MAG: hypothetical protein K9J16_02940 [Melioribacteraceae bacterium]|nr:hypothetical protein [Melioribacteraceae bacterium]MCF8355455.1 hypothetical protein [Melioribacteraceae bacterium]MCF8392568.1 hypothetical protein [Melioribacteraceae bacterium]MCF8418417.1 hypothetical protein [Melioribacteraceae bacterium]
MKQQIIENINNPEKLELLFRSNKKDFSNSFDEVSADYDSDLVHFWKIRLADSSSNDFISFLRLDILILIIISIFSGLLAKLPDFISQLDQEIFFFRNLPIIVFNGLILFVFWQNKIFEKSKIFFYIFSIIVLLLFVNLLPYGNLDSVNVAIIHIPLLLWCLLGLSFISFNYNDTTKKIEFIRFNGEFLIMTGLIILAGGLLTAITLGLFSAINMNIEEFYIQNVAIFGGVAAPIVSYYLILLYPNITSKIAPVIARVFTPLVFVTLSVYLISYIFSGAKIVEDRDLLILFNIVLLAVLAIIVFSISEIDKSKNKNISVLILFLLALLAIVINSIALVAIITRLTYGLTPNRIVVLGSNLLIFVNLIIIAVNLFDSFVEIKKITQVENSLVKYITIYLIWTLLVVFLLPFVFWFQ